MSSWREKLKNVGPGALVAAAFIGPGTVNTATVSGASFGYALLWAMLFSTIATIIFQEMSARLGVVSRQGLGEALRNQFKNPILKVLAIILVIAAIFIGNSAFQTGNIIGGAMGLNAIFPSISIQVWGPLIGIIAFFLLWTGNYKRIEKIFVGMVIVMSVTFLTTAIITLPNIMEILKGLFVPRMPNVDRAWFSVVALIGTTVVPYNLFLHASAVQEKWQNKDSMKEARVDTILSIGLGGLISAAIIVTAAAAFHGTGTELPRSGAQMAVQLEPLLGAGARWMFAIGLFAAGFTSAIAAPLAGAYATSGALGWKRDLKALRFKAVWILILLVGIVLSGLGQGSPQEIILFAQASNALILPIIAVFLMVVVNNKEKMGEYANTYKSNILGAMVILVTIAISIRSLVAFAESLRRLLQG